MDGATRAKDASPRWLKSAADQATRRYAVATAGRRRGPDFLVIGTKRGGTTSLFHYLLQHPGVFGLYPQIRGKKSTDFFFKEQWRGERWYRSHFPTDRQRAARAARLGYQPVSGEASPYYLWDPRVAPSVHRVVPGVRAIALLRDPVERAWSHYQERVQNGVEPLGFVEALAAEQERMGGELERMAADPAYYSRAHDFYSYRARGVYLPQLEAWTAVFPRDRLLVLRSEDMYADVQGVLDRVCEFLGLGTFVVPRGGPFNARHRVTSMPEEAREDLTAFFAPHNVALEQWLGRQLDWSR